MTIAKAVVECQCEALPQIVRVIRPMWCVHITVVQNLRIERTRDRVRAQRVSPCDCLKK